MDNVVAIRLDRKLWINFMAKVKHNRKKVSEVIEPFLRKYIKGEKE